MDVPQYCILKQFSLLQLFAATVTETIYARPPTPVCVLQDGGVVTAQKV